MSSPVGDEVPDLGPVPIRIEVDVEQVRRLVAEQLPQWADLPVSPVARGGWDNRTFHLGDDLLVRLPSAAAYAEAVAKEQRWLPVLAERLPLPVPVPLGLGRPGAGFPFAWSVYGWLDGETASRDRIADPVAFAGGLAGFLVALRAVDAADGPQPGIHNWFRGGTLRTYDATVEEALVDLADHVGHDVVARVRGVWAAALDARWDGVDRWFHGDVAAGNLLLDDAGRLAAVIDFGTCGVGDPACDLAVAWTLLTGEARQVFRTGLDVGDDEWARGRGWALWKALATCGSTAGSTDPEDVADLAEALRVVGEVVGVS